MKKLLLPLLLLTATAGYAQPESRVFTIFTQTYTELPAPTVITTAGWDDFSGKVPIGFNFTLMGKTTDTLYFDESVNIGADMLLGPTGPTHGMAFLTDFIDRSNVTGKPVSTVSYQNFITGAPSTTRVQWKNVGFFGEQAMTGTLNDSVNFQVWVREFNSDVEVHFGPSGIQSPYEDIFDFTAPVFGFVKNIDTAIGSFDYLYYVSATTPTPKVDSMSFGQLVSGSLPTYPAWPANGTVFKFSKPVSGGVNGLQLNEYAAVSPTLVSNDCVVTLSKAGFDGNISLVDMGGRVVLNQKAGEGKNVLDMGSLVPGNYVLNIRSKEASVFYKITKQ